jgi:hypothetical protein
MALDAILGKAECCTSSSSSTVFSFDIFNTETGTNFSPIAVDLNEQRTTTSSLQTATLVIIPLSTIPESFDISSYTSFIVKELVGEFQYSWGRIETEGEITERVPYIYYAMTSHEIVTASQFLPAGDPNTYTFQFTTTITYNIAHMINQFITVPSLIITGTIPASFMFGSGIYNEGLKVLEYDWGTIDISGTTNAGIVYLSLLSADAILSASNFINTGGNNYTLNYNLTRDTVFTYIGNFDDEYLIKIIKSIAAAIITGYPSLLGVTFNNLYQAVIVYGGDVVPFLAFI